jgi:hypothetical protein
MNLYRIICSAVTECYICLIKIKEDKMTRVCSMVGMRNAYVTFISTPEGKRPFEKCWGR